MPIDKSKLGTRTESANLIPTFLFKPQKFVNYETALKWQQNWQKHLFEAKKTAQAIWLLEHPLCYTMGKGSSEKNLLFDPLTSKWPLYKINRGGEVTCHMPGQLVAYPVLDLRKYQTDLHWYLRKLEAVLINVLTNLGLAGKKRKGLTGVWIEDRKVASIGVSCRRWVTQHGLALNVNCDMEAFRAVVPCGLVNHPMGKINDWIPGITVEEVKPLLMQSFKKHFHLDWKKMESLERPEEFSSYF